MELYASQNTGTFEFNKMCDVNNLPAALKDGTMVAANANQNPPAPQYQRQ
jgi:hypothetical protein